MSKVRELQRGLYVAARTSKTRRFHALHDRVRRRDVLRTARERIRENGGAAGVDGNTIGDIERDGVEAFLDVLEADWPSKWPFKRVYDELRLHRLSRTVVYLSEAAPRRPLESRVRENRKHGLNGGFQKQAGHKPVLR